MEKEKRAEGADVNERPVTFESEHKDSVASREWALLGVLCAALLCFWMAHYHRFLVPSADYLEIEQTSRAIWSGHLPLAYKRMPILSILMGPLRLVTAGPHPDLQAALILNIAFSLGSVALLFLLTRRLLGWVAIVPVAVYSTLWIFHEMALAPLLEPSMGFFILLSLALWQRRSRWQYAALFAAALTRYEAAALIPIFFALNAVYERRIVKPLLLSALASSGFLVWMALSAMHSAYGNPYFQVMKEAGIANHVSFVYDTLRQSFGGFRETRHVDEILGIAALVSLFGVWVSWRRFRRESIALISFLIVYVAIHILYGIDMPRYAHPVAWIPVVYLTLGVQELIRRPQEWPVVRARVPWRIIAPPLAFLAAIFAGVSVWDGFRFIFREQGVLAHWNYALLFAVVLGVLTVCAAVAGRRSLPATAKAASEPRWKTIIASLALLAIVAPAVACGLGTHESRSWEIYYQNVEPYAMAQWLSGNMAPGERALAPFPTLVTFCHEFKPGTIMPFGELRSETEEEMAREAAKRRVTYVCYSSYTPREWWGAAREIYSERRKLSLMNLFEDGKDHPPFRRVARIDFPTEARKSPVYIYRFSPA